MIYSIILTVTAVLLALLYILLSRKNTKAGNIIYKVACILLAIAFFFRHQMDGYHYFYSEILREADSKGIVALSLILVWLQNIVIVLLAVSPFIKIKQLSRFIAYLALPITIVNIFLFSQNCFVLFGNADFNFRLFAFFIETMLSAVIAFSHMWFNGKFKATKNEILVILACIIPMAFLSMPYHYPQVFIRSTPPPRPN